MYNVVASLLFKFVVYFLEKIAFALPMILKKWKDEKQREIREEEQKKAMAEYQVVASKPEATAEEKAKAYEKAINAGRF
jgi:hypothetical protein